MPAVKQTTTPFNADHLVAIAETLERMASTLRSAAACAETQESKTLAIFNAAGVEPSIRRLKGFVDDSETSALAARLGKPRQVGEMKPRSDRDQKRPDAGREVSNKEIAANQDVVRRKLREGSKKSSKKPTQD